MKVFYLIIYLSFLAKMIYNISRLTGTEKDNINYYIRYKKRSEEVVDNFIVFKKSDKEYDYRDIYILYKVN